MPLIRHTQYNEPATSCPRSGTWTAKALKRCRTVMAKQIHEALKWKESENKITVYEQLMWSISWANIFKKSIFKNRAASLKTDYLWTCTEWTQPRRYEYPGGVKPEYGSRNAAVKGAEGGGFVSFARTHIFLRLKALCCFVPLSPRVSCAWAIPIAVRPLQSLWCVSVSGWQLCFGTLFCVLGECCSCDVMGKAGGTLLGDVQVSVSGISHLWCHCSLQDPFVWWMCILSNIFMPYYGGRSQDMKRSSSWLGITRQELGDTSVGPALPLLGQGFCIPYKHALLYSYSHLR